MNQSVSALSVRDQNIELRILFPNSTHRATKKNVFITSNTS